MAVQQQEFSSERVKKLVETARSAKFSPRYCVEPILKTIPSLAIKWQDPTPVAQNERLDSEEGPTLINLNFGGNTFQNGYWREDQNSPEPSQPHDHLASPRQILHKDAL